MNKEVENGFNLLINKESSNQIIRLFGLIALNVSLKKIAKKWSSSIFEHVEYTNANRVGVQFGKDDLFWKMDEKYNYNWFPGSFESDSSQVEGSWDITIEYFLNGEIKKEDIGVKQHGFDPFMVEKYFLIYLEEWIKSQQN